MHDVAKIKAVRTKRKLTQAAAGKLAGMSVQQWNDIETGRVSTKWGLASPTLERVAKALGVKAKDLLK